jgi:hypothetical protein
MKFTPGIYSCRLKLESQNPVVSVEGVREAKTLSRFGMDFDLEAFRDYPAVDPIRGTNLSDKRKI